MLPQNILVVLSGPSGAGKGALHKVLLQKMPNLRYSLSATTRKPRVGEIDGVHYQFISKQKFQQMINDGDFLEWAQVYDHYYGTPRKKVEDYLAQGYDVLLEIDTQGALQIKDRFPEGVFIFIAPPSLSELRKRITKRATETEKVIEKRLRCAHQELSFINAYQYLVVNDNLNEAVAKLKAIMIAEKCRLQRNPGYWEIEGVSRE